MPDTLSNFSSINQEKYKIGYLKNENLKEHIIDQ